MVLYRSRDSGIHTVILTVLRNLFSLLSVVKKLTLWYNNISGSGEQPQPKYDVK